MSARLHPSDDGRLSIIIAVTGQSVQAFHEGKRTLIHLPVTLDMWAHDRALAVGDEIGLSNPPFPRVRMTPIVRIDEIDLHDMDEADLPCLGYLDLDQYRQLWDVAWSDRGYAWAQNPRVYAIRWAPVCPPSISPPCPPPTQETSS